MVDDLLAALGPYLDRVRAKAEADADFRALLRAVGRTLQALAAEPPAAGPAVTAVATAPAADEQPAAPPQPAGLPPRPVGRQAPRPLAPSEPPARIAFPAAEGPWQPSPVTADDLPIIEVRCRLKAEACRRLAEHTPPRDGAASPPDVDFLDLITRAQELPDCYLWMCRRDRAPTAAARIEALAGCYEAAAEAADLLRVAGAADAELLPPALDLAAEAQSALRGAVAAANGRLDNDQVRLYIAIKEAAARRGYFIQRYMRSEDPADPAGSDGLRERIRQLGDRFRAVKDRERRQRKLLLALRHHVKQIVKDPAGDRDADWRKVIDSVEELVAGGLPPSNPDLRDLLLPVVEVLPDGAEVPKHFGLVLREIDRYLATRIPDPAPAAAAPAPPEVRRVAELLRGREVVLIGGEGRPFAAEALREAFGLRELIWVGTRDHQSHAPFEPYVARPDVAVVLLAIRWSNHGFGEVKEFCDKYGKPLVRLKAGYHPNQVAMAVLSQAGERLAAERVPA